MQAVFVGDFMLSGDQAGKQIKVSNQLKKRLSSFDIRIATLETAVGTYEDIDEIKRPQSEVAVWSKAEDLHKLTDLNVNVVSLANNHACDCGVESMLNLAHKLREIGIKPIGGGQDLTEAMNPVVFEKDGESLAIIACCQNNPNSLGTIHFASETNSGIYKLDENVIIPQIRDLKKQYNYVAVMIHWGIEHKWLPENGDVAIGQRLIDAGADIIIGGHPHHIQPLVKYNNHSIYYSLGNFHFPDFCLDKVSNVYYPSDDELKKLPVFDWMAPERRNFSMLYFWKYYARLGMMAPITLKKGAIKAHKQFVLYKKGRISFSLIGWWHSLELKVLSFVTGKASSVKINYLITRTREIVEYKILARLFKKYSFHEYIQKHNYED